jgi:murein DD-endopeptidase MepM/ murein hydrolase activator NlpD
MDFKLWYPIKPLRVNQPFGVNPDPVVNGKYLALGLKGHNGIDMWADHGQPVYAAHDGVVQPIIVDTYGGHGITILTMDVFDYEGRRARFKTIYWHFIAGSEQVKQGQLVKVGDLLGYADNTGYSWGDHLHFGLKAVNEFGGDVFDMDNGFKGSIDPKPYFNGYYAVDKQTVVSIIQQEISLYQMLLELIRRIKT